ncbi:MAG: alpha-galactosidase [Propionibacteriaceae bacterium]
MSASDLLSAILAQLPGSVVLDGVPSRLADWDRSEPTDAGTAQTFTLTHPGGLTATVTQLGSDGVVEWRVQLQNDADVDSGVLSELRPLHLSWPVSAGEQAVLETTNGSLCRLDDFLPWARPLTEEPVHLEPVGGRSSDGAMPFLTVSSGGVSLGVAIGWSGQWAADLAAEDAVVRVQAGLAHSHLRLHAGERITLPSILVTAVDGDADAAANALRSALERTVTPHGPGGRPVTPLAHMTMSTFHVTKTVSEASELEAVRRAADLGLEAFWVDACWYGETPLWSEQVGNWNVRTEAFPRGLRPISDAAHEAGMKFVLWIEPERARVGTRLLEQRPEFFLTFPDDPHNVLLDLGHPEARESVLKLVSGYIDEFAVDIYRQDFNIRPLAAWRAADAPDRQGSHEIRHVEGLYWLWDALLERHPGLVIDNCASGGRRIDLETMRRSVPLWRSDSADVGGGAAGDNVPLANQVQVSGLSRYVAQHTGPVWAFDPYHIRSAMSTGFVVYCPLPEDEEARNQLAAAVAEVQRLRPLLAGEFHSLLEPTLDQQDWSASQFHRPEQGDGVAVVLRRPASPDPETRVSLRGIDPRRRYRVTLSPTYEQAALLELAGAELLDLTVTIPAAPGAVLVEYARAD